MITIISGTNRRNSYTNRVALEYKRLLADRNIDAAVLSLSETDMSRRDETFISAEKKFLIPATAFIIIMPEYNGSYPGILKLMIDNTDISQVWWHKKVLLTGVSTGRAGNLRGMEHITGSLLHLKMLVHPNRLPLSIVDKLMDEGRRFTDASTLRAIETQLDEFLDF